MNARTSGAAAGTAGGSGAHMLRIVAVVVAVALQAVILVPFTVASGLLAPLWAIIVLYAVWVAAAAGLYVTARRRPLAAPIVPLINGALLFGFITFGDTVLGWTA